MKWKDWISAVEEKMKEQGIEENPEIFYIDTHMPIDKDSVDVTFGEDGMDITSF